MKRKYLPLILLGLVLTAVIVILTVDISSVNINVNIIKYHSATADGKDFSFYGSFGTVGKVTVRENGKKVCSLKISADADVYSSSTAVELCDLNADGKKDILIAYSTDNDGDVHRKLFLATQRGYSLVDSVDAVNFSEKNSTIISEEKQIVYLAPQVEEYTVPYEKYVSRTVYEYYDGTVIPSSMLKVSYYSESDVYCVGKWEYYAELEELIPVSEDWLSPSEYLSVREKLAKDFSAELP